MRFCTSHSFQGDEFERNRFKKRKESAKICPVARDGVVVSV